MPAPLILAARLVPEQLAGREAFVAALGRTSSFVPQSGIHELQKKDSPNCQSLFRSRANIACRQPKIL
jgi:hypothetical protein